MDCPTDETREEILLKELLAVIEENTKNGDDYFEGAKLTRDLTKQLERHISDAPDTIISFPCVVMALKDFEFDPSSYGFRNDIENHAKLKVAIIAVQKAYISFPAAEKGQAVPVEAFLMDYPNYKDASGPKGCTLLYLAARNKHLELAKLLLEKHRCDVNAPSIMDGGTPLHAAGLADDAAMVAYLLSKGANESVANVHNSLPRTPKNKKPTASTASAAGLAPKMPNPASLSSMRYRPKLPTDGSVDVCIVMDCTSSMKVQLNAVKDKLVKMSMDIQQSMRQKGTVGKLRIGFVAYRDFNHPLPEQFQILALTEDINALHTQLNQVEVKKAPNSDWAEDVHGGLEKAAALDWKAALRVVVLVGDAPCHGKQYNTEGYDNYPEHDANFKRSEEVLRALQHKQIDFHFFRIDPTTEKMEAKWKEMYNQFDAVRKWETHELSDTKSADKILNSLVQAVVMSNGRKNTGP